MFGSAPLESKSLSKTHKTLPLNCRRTDWSWHLHVKSNSTLIKRTLSIKFSQNAWSETYKDSMRMQNFGICPEYPFVYDLSSVAKVMKWKVARPVYCNETYEILRVMRKISFIFFGTIVNTLKKIDKFLDQRDGYKILYLRTF